MNSVKIIKCNACLVLYWRQILEHQSSENRIYETGSVCYEFVCIYIYIYIYIDCNKLNLQSVLDFSLLLYPPHPHPPSPSPQCFPLTLTPHLHPPMLTPMLYMSYFHLHIIFHITAVVVSLCVYFGTPYTDLLARSAKQPNRYEFSCFLFSDCNVMQVGILLVCFYFVHVFDGFFLVCMYVCVCVWLVVRKCNIWLLLYFCHLYICLSQEAMALCLTLGWCRLSSSPACVSSHCNFVMILFP